MRKRILFVLLAVFLQACGTRPFVPAEYSIDPTLIPTFDVNGQVTITNGQSSTDSILVYSAGPNKWSSDLHAITASLTQQAIEELNKHQNLVGNTKSKTIQLKVDSLYSEHNQVVWNSSMNIEAKLGDGELVTLSIRHTSGWSMDQDLNGCIADVVVALFKNDKVLSYLSN